MARPRLELLARYAAILFVEVVTIGHRERSGGTTFSNPKSEYRNPKQARMIKFKIRRAAKVAFGYSDFEIVSIFEFRISKLE